MQVERNLFNLQKLIVPITINMLLIRKAIHRTLLIYKTKISRKLLFIILLLVSLRFFFNVDISYLYAVLFLNLSLFILSDIFIKRK